MKHMFRRNTLYIFTLLCAYNIIPAQKKDISLEAIYKESKFNAKTAVSYTFSNDGNSYIVWQENKIIRKDLLSDHEIEVLFDAASVENGRLKSLITDFELSQDNKKILLISDSKSIYRRSKESIAYVYDLNSKKLTDVFPGNRILIPTFSHDGKKLSFVYNNNIYIKFLETDKLWQVTHDGKNNFIKNGISDWLYEEEFAKTNFMTWSSKSDRLAFVRFDESEVKEYSLDYYREGMYPDKYAFKYPKVGESNSKVSLHIFNIQNKNKIIQVPIDEKNDFYLPRLSWTVNNDKLSYTLLNRKQNELKLMLFDVASKKQTELLRESDKRYVEVNDNLFFLKSGNQFIWQSDRDGYIHLYLYTIEGKLIQQLTTGSDEVAEVFGLDDSQMHIFYSRFKNQGKDRLCYKLSLNSGQEQLISESAGYNQIVLGYGAKMNVMQHSDINTPPSFTLIDANGLVVKDLEKNQRLLNNLNEYNISKIELMNIPNETGIELNTLLIKPLNFDSVKKYPVLMFLYGGPGSQKAINKWNAMADYPWYQMLAQKNYVIAVVDNRGTGGRGADFKKSTYLQLGKYETEDQIAAAKYLSKLEFIDSTRIGIWGWSYGGYMSSLCILKGNDVFKSAMAVAPVTNWKWYDSAYTERFMGNEKENPAGYRENSPVNFANKLKGNYLLVHGLADDNVHFQNSAEMINALVKANKQFDLYVYPNRNHGITGDNARLHLFTKLTNFVLEKI